MKFVVQSVALALLILPSWAQQLRANSGIDAGSRFLKKKEELPEDLDAEPPEPDESVCDRYEGQAKGICNAYCEAQECAGINDKQSCESLRKNFEKATGERKLPCDPSRCPCWDDLKRQFFGDQSLPMLKSHFDRSQIRYYNELLQVYNSKFQVGAEFGRSVPGQYSCWVFDLEERRDVVDEVIETAETFLHCVYDIVALSKDADITIPGSTESACEDYDVEGTETTCPCWDNHDPNIFPPIKSLESFDSESFHRERDDWNRADWDIGSYRYSAFSQPAVDRYFCLQSGNGREYNLYITGEEFKVCYNDLLKQSASVGENKCHWYA
jgi:hypothetical protein